MNKIECWFNPLVIADGSCSLKLVDRNTQLVSGTAYIIEPQNLARIHLTVFYKFRVYRKFLIDVDYDLCSVLEHPMVAMALPLIRKHSNRIDFKCPFQGNYTISRLKYDKQYVPKQIVPSGQYRFDLRVYHPMTNATAFEGKLYCTVPESRDAHVDRSMG